MTLARDEGANYLFDMTDAFETVRPLLLHSISSTKGAVAVKTPTYHGR